MAAVQQKQTSCHSSLTERSPECSIIVDDVDENNRLRIESSSTLLMDDESNSECALKRIEEFQKAAEDRKLEFARLLEEHAQVIRRLKQMEGAESSTTAVAAQDA